MPREWEERDDEEAAGAICPMPGCGIEFTVPEDEPIFQSVPKDVRHSSSATSYSLFGSMKCNCVGMEDAE
jgi:hypothetical protein